MVKHAMGEFPLMRSTVRVVSCTMLTPDFIPNATKKLKQVVPGKQPRQTSRKSVTMCGLSFGKYHTHLFLATFPSVIQT